MAYQSTSPCKFYIKGGCLKGDKCRFLHAIERVDTAATIPIPIRVPASVNAEETATIQPEDDTVLDTEENWCRELGGAVVDFGNGATVTNISFASDFSAVRLRDLPSDATPRSVVLLLARYTQSWLDLEQEMASEANVRVIPPTADDPGHCQADVRVKDPQFATRLCAAVPTMANAFSVVAVSSSVALPPQTKTQATATTTASSVRRVDSKKVFVSWHKQTKSVWLNFGSGNIAEKVAESFQSGAYTVCGQRVRAESSHSEPPEHTGGHHRRQRGFGYQRIQNPLAWTVTLSDVPASAGEADIKLQIPAGLRPRHVEFGRGATRARNNGAGADFATASASIHSLLLQAGPLEWWEDSTGAFVAGKRHKAKARFLHETDAARAVEMFNDQPLPFNRLDRLTVQLVHTARLKVAAGVYAAAAGTILGHVKDWKSRHVQFTHYPVVHGFCVLKVEGAVRQDVAGAKATLEEVLGGTTALQGDGKTPLWSPAFSRRRGEGQDKGEGEGGVRHRLKKLEEHHGVAFLYDWRRSEVRVVGAPARRRTALDALAALAQDVQASGAATTSAPAKTAAVITLDIHQLTWASRGGYRAIVDAVGPDKARLDIVSTPKRILVSGENEYRTVMEMLLAGCGSGSGNGNGRSGACKGKATTTLVVQAAATCAVCWTEAENAVQTPCHHVYCGDCFEELCHAGEESSLGIRCVGDAATCDVQLALDTLQAHLSSAVLEDVLEAAFAAHVARHVDELRNCPTADCGQIYRVSSATKTLLSPSPSALFTCPACLSPVCRACHAAHEGISCAEYKYRASGGYEALNVAKKDLGIKDCPKCGTMIEKIDGCNHMTCAVCQVHICWVCLQTFSNGKLVYDHLDKVHGGFVDVIW